MGYRRLKRRRHGAYACNVFCACPAVALLRAALYETLEHDALSAIEQPHALRTVEFMRGQRQHIYIVFGDVHGDMPYRLHRVAVEGYAVRPAHGAYFPYRLDCADLVIGIHNRNERRIGTDCPFDLLRRDKPVGMHVEIGDLEALLFELFAGMEHGVMFECRGDYVLFALGKPDVCRRTQSLIVRLAAAGREIYFLRVRTQKLCYLRACALERLLRPLPYRVQGRRIAKVVL